MATLRCAVNSKSCPKKVDLEHVNSLFSVDIIVMMYQFAVSSIARFSRVVPIPMA